MVYRHKHKLELINMKNKNGIVIALFSLLAVLAFAPGCTSVRTVGADGTAVTNSVPDPTILRITAQEAAALGGQFWLAEHPENRPEFELARTSLAALIATGNGTPADLQAALAQLPIKQLEGSSGAVIISGAVVLLDAAGRQLVKLDSKQVWSAYVEPVAQGLLAGLDQALATPVPRKP